MENYCECECDYANNCDNSNGELLTAFLYVGSLLYWGLFLCGFMHNFILQEMTSIIRKQKNMITYIDIDSISNSSASDSDNNSSASNNDSSSSNSDNDSSSNSDNDSSASDSDSDSNSDSNSDNDSSNSNNSSDNDSSDENNKKVKYIMRNIKKFNRTRTKTN